MKRRISNSRWAHKSKFKGHVFSGRYTWFEYSFNGNERVFELINIRTGRAITFESWQMAKDLGWEKIK